MGLDQAGHAGAGDLTHARGHSEKVWLQASRDDSGNKNAIQALGSTISYGRRYTTCDLLNITSRLPQDRAKILGIVIAHYREYSAK